MTKRSNTSCSGKVDRFAPPRIQKAHGDTTIMTHAINIPNNLSCNIAAYETQWPVFTQSNPPEYCGHIHRIAAWVVPTSVHQQLGLPDNLDLYLTDKGHWAPTLEIAEHFIITDCPLEFICKGSTLSFFVPAQWAEGNGGSTKAYGDCRVFRTADGSWDARPIRVDQGLVHDAATF
jgi:hypothetical protein